MTRHLLALALFLAAPSVRAEVPTIVELSADQEAAALAVAADTGAAIHRHDRAAAVATDAALALRAFRKDKRVRGWITEERQGEIVVTFIDPAPAALYRATVSATGALVGDVSVLDSPTPLTGFEAGAAAARATALASDFPPCADKYNSVVLPAGDAGSNRWVVYLLPATTKNDVVPIGGTFRVETAGPALVSRRGFTRTCIALQNDPRAVALMVSHLLDPVPTEAHVFWSLWAKKALYVATPPQGTLWAVEGDRIKLVKRGTGGN